MQIVINIDEEVYKRTLPYKDLPIISNLANDYDEITHAVANGVILPKGHGRIGDLDFLAKRIKCKLPIGEIGKVTLDECYQEVLSTKTIIEADKAESEKA